MSLVFKFIKFKILFSFVNIYIQKLLLFQNNLNDADKIQFEFFHKEGYLGNRIGKKSSYQKALSETWKKK